MSSEISFSERVSGALHGLFIADALAMPVHWYYDRQALLRDYGRVTQYLAPRNPHPDSILWRSAYEPVNDKGDILHEQGRFWGRRGVHYHQFLEAGENTLNLKLCLLLINHLINHNGYDADSYVDDYIAFMTTPGNHSDTYAEEYHRHFFINYAQGKHPRACGIMEKHISGIIGMIPLAVYYDDDVDLARQLAFEHLHLTHLGPRMEAAGEPGVGFVVTWQEDPDGLRPGEGEGPGEGWSGAVAHHETDIWYAFLRYDDFSLVDDFGYVAATTDDGVVGGGFDGKDHYTTVGTMGTGDPTGRVKIDALQKCYINISYK